MDKFYKPEVTPERHPAPPRDRVDHHNVDHRNVDHHNERLPSQEPRERPRPDRGPSEVNEEDTSSVVFLHNLAEHGTPDMLFNLFSIYGNVNRVKIFFKRRDMGLI